VKARGNRQRARVVLEGAFGIYEAVARKQVLLDALEGAQALDIDVAGVTELDTAGLQLLVMVKREAAARGKRASLVAHSPAVLEVLDTYGLAAYFGDAVVIPSVAKPRRG
jgi:anti-anti-sigma factor